MKESVRVASGAAKSNSSQRAKKLVSDSLGLVDSIGQVNCVLKGTQSAHDMHICIRYYFLADLHVIRYT